MNEHYPFKLTPLPYPCDALEPYIDKLTVEVHHDRHQAGYVKKLNEALADCPDYHCWSLEQLICSCPPISGGMSTATPAASGHMSFISTA